MGITPITFRLVPGLRVSPRHALGFLDGSPDLAWSIFNGLSQKDRDWIMTGMGLWIDDTPSERRHHRFPDDYSDCHVFKYVRENHRFYGFKYNPQPNTNERFQICVVTTYAFKTDKMDYGDLKRVHTWRDAPASKKAVAFVFPDKEEKAVKQ
jgi:hypothetical protein